MYEFDESFLDESKYEDGFYRRLFIVQIGHHFKILFLVDVIYPTHSISVCLPIDFGSLCHK